MLRRFVFIAPLIVALGSACASAPSPGAETAPQNLLTAEQIQASSATSVEQLIRSTRPMWLSSRGAMGMRHDAASGEASDDAALVVYVDDVRYGGVAELGQLPLTGVRRIEFVDARAATLRWGTGHPRGAILISTSRAGP